MSAALSLIKLPRLTSIVDVGAAPIDSAPPYKAMLAAGLCSLTGFEPNPEMLSQLRAKAGPHEQYWPDVIGDGLAANMHQCVQPGMNSLLRPDPERCAVWRGLAEAGEVMTVKGTITRRLDDAVPHMDMLKIDVQGAEMIVFDGATKLLDGAVAVQVEVAWNPLYMAQPAWGEIDCDLRMRGFTLFRVVHGNGTKIMPGPFPEDDLVDCDAVYVRDFAKMDRMTEPQVGHLAMIAHYCYSARNLTWRCLAELQKRGRLDSDTLRRYQIG